MLLNATIPGSDIEFYTATYSYTKYLPFTRYFTFLLNADLRYGKAFGDTTAVPPYKNYFGGGPNTVRGFRENSLGPRDTFGNPYGGNILTAGQAELIMPIPRKWQSAVPGFAVFRRGQCLFGRRCCVLRYVLRDEQRAHV